MSLKRLFELAGVASQPRAKKLIEAEEHQAPVYYVTDQKLEIIKPGRYRHGKDEFLYAYPNKQLAIDNAIGVNKHSNIFVYELNQSEFPYKKGDRFATMFFVVPIRSYVL